MMTSIYSYEGADAFITGEAVKSGDGYVSEWWVSTSTRGYARVIGQMSIPIYGTNQAQADARLEMLAPEVEKMFSRSWGGDAVTLGRRPRNVEHIELHVAHYVPFVVLWSDLDQVAALYELLSGFRVKNPSPIIARGLDVASVRTIHDRIARARKLGIISKFGRGRSYAA